jgi:hypothetical protein
MDDMNHFYGLQKGVSQCDFLHLNYAIHRKFWHDVNFNIHSFFRSFYIGFDIGVLDVGMVVCSVGLLASII